MDKEKFTDIICANEQAYRSGGDPFYTNSTQLPVNYTDDIFEALDLQDKIQQKYTGGTVLHLYAGEQVEDPHVIREMVRRICTTYHLPYFTFTPTFSVCASHGYLSGEVQTCPQCGGSTEVYSRVTGYLRPVAQWNNGKRQEFMMRTPFKVDAANPSLVETPWNDPAKGGEGPAPKATGKEISRGTVRGISLENPA